MKFSIRDLLLVTMIVALATAWGIDHRKLGEQIEELTPHFGLHPNGQPYPILDIEFRQIGDRWPP